MLHGRFTEESNTGAAAAEATPLGGDAEDFANM